MRILAAVVALLLVLVGAPPARADHSAATRLREATLVRGASEVPPFPDGGAPVTLPHAWSAQERAEGGEAWYLLRWSVPAAAAGQAILLPAVTVPTEVWLNGEVLGRTGPLSGRPPRSFEQALLVAVPDEFVREGDNVVALRVRAQPGASSAALDAIEAGDMHQLARQWLRDLAAHTLGPAAIGVAMLAGGGLILGLWARRRDPAYSLFAVAALLWGSHTLVSLLPEPPLPQPHWFVWWHGVYMLFVSLLCLFMVRFAEVEWRPYRRAVIALALATVPVLYAAVALGVREPTAVAVRGIALVLVLVALYANVRRAVRVRNAENLLLLATGAVSAAFGVHDWMAANSDAVRPVWLVPYAALAFLLLVGWILTDRFVRALNDSERANQALEARVGEKSVALARQLAATQEARDAAEAANVAKSRFLAAASHDLRQPLHAIGLFTAALAEHANAPEQAVLVQRITRSVESLETLFSALLDISKLDAGVVTAQPRDFALDPMLDSLAQEFAPEALAKGLKLAVVPTAVVVRSDPILLERILRNFIANAMRYTVAGGVVVGCRRRGSAVALEVSDSGPGIEAKDRERVFEEFYQAGSRELDRAGGLGLGLAIVRRLATLLGHGIELDSRPARGSTFRVVVPRGDPARVPVAPPSEVPALHALDGRRILVIEDETPVRVGTEGLLRSWGCVPMLAADADTAADLACLGDAPDAAIVDFRLRVGSDGLAALATIEQRLGRRLPAVIVSGESHPEELARIQASGCLLLHKPVAPARLHAALAWLIVQGREPPAADARAA